ncbi:RES family NAD+ phosphorylase [Dyadobacter sp. NIV53]|uniref:RES family NAD+ phosphorylase n=1 Tax=Dyadobacter sp. NIV53 TaxID=2861765 RepID=UPI001C87517B|nr:RES domain-containing protein [Dyadobacter sp. NIV53]
MIVYRLAAKEYISDKLGTGARLFGGRWNPQGLPCIYTSEHISLALLEKYVHAQSRENMERIALIKIEVPDIDGLIFNTDEKLLKTNWADDISYSQWIGEQILKDLSIIAFTVPSAIIPLERNVIINPLAIKSDLIKFSEPIDFSTDFRLLSRLMK